MRRFVAAVMLASSCVGCVPSLHGIANKQQSVMNDKLQGVWKRSVPQAASADSEARWKFTPDADRKAYHLDYTDAYENVGEFTARLTKIGEHHYLDLFPVKPHKVEEVDFEDASGFFKHHMFPVHTFIRIEDWEPLRISFLDLRRMDQYLKDHPDAIAHERTDVHADLLLTASTTELRQFLESVASDRQLFTTPIVLQQE